MTELQECRWVGLRVVRVRGLGRVQLRESRVVEASGRYLEATRVVLHVVPSALQCKWPRRCVRVRMKVVRKGVRGLG